MASITHWDPFREVNTLRNVMEQMVRDREWPERSWSDGGGSSTYGLALDVSEDEDEFMVKASVPGINPDDLDISLNDNMLTIKGEVKDEKEKETKGQYHLRERRYGAFMRSISLPSSVNAEEANADFEDGVLTLHLPKSEETKPRRISVGGRKTIEAETNGSNSNSRKTS